MLAVAGGKGGVGKTTTTLELGRALGRAGRRPLAVDCDLGMPDLARVAGLADPERGGLAAVADGAGAADAARRVPGAALSVLGPGVDADGRTVERALARLDWPGPVVLDCPAGAGRGAARPLRAADRAVVVSTAEPAGLRGAAKTAAMARTLGASVAGVVVTRRERPPAGVERLLGTPVLACVPETEEPASAAASAHARAAAELF
jgi:septum site-determining protein MinD